MSTPASLDRNAIAVRPYRAGDEQAIASVFFTSVREAARRDYSPAQVQAWAQEPPDPARFAAQATDGRLFLVAVTADDQVVGYGDLEADGHIDHLYCAPAAVGAGIGSLLYEALESHAVEHGYPRLFVEASEAARRLFERHGFVVEHRNDLERAGVALHNFSMHKLLHPPVGDGPAPGAADS